MREELLTVCIEDRQQLSDGQALHIEGSSTIDPSVVDDATKGRKIPPLGIDYGVDIDVIVQDDGFVGFTFQNRPEIRLVVSQLLDMSLEPSRLQVLREKQGSVELAAGCGAGVDTDVIAK